MALVAPAVKASWWRRWAPAALVGPLALAAAACGLGGAGGEGTLALLVDDEDPNRPVLVLAEDPVAAGEPLFVRLEVPEPLDAKFVRVRIEKRVGTSFQQRGEYQHAVTPPWNVAVIPITLEEPGEWNVALIANSRKITDVEVEVERR